MTRARRVKTTKATAKTSVLAPRRSVLLYDRQYSEVIHGHAKGTLTDSPAARAAEITPGAKIGGVVKSVRGAIDFEDACAGVRAATHKHVVLILRRSRISSKTKLGRHSGPVDDWRKPGCRRCRLELLSARRCKSGPRRHERRDVDGEETCSTGPAGGSVELAGLRCATTRSRLAGPSRATARRSSDTPPRSKASQHPIGLFGPWWSVPHTDA